MIKWFVPVALALFGICGCTDSTQESTMNAEAVRQEVARCWQAYKQYAWGQDALKPLSKSAHNWYDHSLLMTPVDAFDTLHLMGLKEEAEECKQLIFEQLDFDRDLFVQQFEIHIRLLGGLISAYQLDGDPRFLNLAVDLADRLLPAYDSPTGMPYVMVNLRTGEARGAISNPTEIGCMMLELGALSKLSGNPVYYDKSKAGIQTLHSLRSKIGLVGNSINIETGQWTGTECHLGGGIDAYYEYLLKAWLLFDDPDFKDMWDVSIDALNEHLTIETETGFYYTHVDMHTGEVTVPYFGALDAFFPGVLVLHGDLDRASRLQDSCFNAWTKYGVEPESYNIHTLEVGAPFYILRPEIVESTYYLQRFTGDSKYTAMGEVLWHGLIEHCRTDVAFAAIEDVRTMKKSDSMESFFLAETLKYFWLLFEPRDVIDFEQVVFNSEAHPIRKSWSSAQVDPGALGTSHSDTTSTVPATKGFSWIVPDELAAMPVPGRSRSLDLDAAYLAQEGVEVLVSLTETPPDAELLASRSIAHRHIPVEDFHPPTLEQMIEFVSVVQDSVAVGKRVAVHCTAGLGRSGTMAAAYLVARGATTDEAIASVRKLRPGSIETADQEDAVRQFEDSLQRPR